MTADPGFSVQNYDSLVNTVLISVVGGLVGWFAQDMRKRIFNIERRLGATVRALFYFSQSDRRSIPLEAQKALEEAMKEIK